MTLNVRSAGTPRQGHTKHLLVAAASVAVALAALAGVAVWQAYSSGDEERAKTEVSPGAAGAPAVQPAGARSEDRVLICYLVGSQEQAAAVWAALAEADIYRPQVGEPVPGTRVLVVATANDEATLWMLAQQEAIRFVDLRTPPAATDLNLPSCVDGERGDSTLSRFACR
jgi:hypothetical protein